MGVTYYCHLHRLFDDVLAEEPEVRERLKELLDEITIDEVAHVGQRRNFVGPLGMKVSKSLVKPFYTLFFNDIPEIKTLFNVNEMIADGLAFDFNKLPDYMIERSWIPPRTGPERRYINVMYPPCSHLASGLPTSRPSRSRPRCRNSPVNSAICWRIG